MVLGLGVVGTALLARYFVFIGDAPLCRVGVCETCNGVLGGQQIRGTDADIRSGDPPYHDLRDVMTRRR
jgi:hypothetical protein